MTVGNPANMEEQALKKITMKKGASRTVLYIEYNFPPGFKTTFNRISEMSSNTWTHEIFQERFSLVNSTRFALLYSCYEGWHSFVPKHSVAHKTPEAQRQALKRTLRYLAGGNID